MHRKKVVKTWKNWRGQFIPGNIFFRKRVTSVFYFTFVCNIIIYINILKLDLINTGLSMSIIERFKNSPYLVVKYLKEGQLFQEREQWPPIFISFPDEATYYLYLSLIQ